MTGSKSAAGHRLFVARKPPAVPVVPKSFSYVSLLRFQMLHGGVHQFQLLLGAAGQLLDVFQRLLGLELRQLLPKLLLRLL